MPPSDDTQGLIGEGASPASHEPSTVMVTIDATPSSDSASAALDSSLQDQLANVFEEKMSSPRPDLEESPMTATSETSSNCSSQAAINELQQPSLEKPMENESTVSAAVEATAADETDSDGASKETTTEETVAEVDTPLSLSDTAELIETTAQQEIGEQQEQQQQAEGEAEANGPLSLIRKGAVAAVGGTMVSTT